MIKNLNLNSKVCHIQYAPISYTEKISVIKNECSVIFNHGKAWLDFYATPGSIELEFPQEIVQGNTVYKQKVPVFFPGLDKTNVNDLFNADAILYIVKLTLNSGDEYIVGLKENPAQYREQFSTTKGGRSIIFWCDAAEAPFPYKK